MNSVYPDKLLIVGINDISIYILRVLCSYFSYIYDGEESIAKEAIEIWDYKDLNINSYNLKNKSGFGLYLPNTNKAFHLSNILGLLDGNSPIAKTNKLNPRLLNKSLREIKYPLIISFTKDKQTQLSIIETLEKRFKIKSIDNCIYVIVDDKEINLGFYIRNNNKIYNFNKEPLLSSNLNINKNIVETDIDEKDKRIVENKYLNSTIIINKFKLGSLVLSYIDKLINLKDSSDIPISITGSEIQYKYLNS